jgi:hypothetical protein
MSRDSLTKRSEFSTVYIVFAHVKAAMAFHTTPAGTLLICILLPLDGSAYQKKKENEM